MFFLVVVRWYPFRVLVSLVKEPQEGDPYHVVAILGLPSLYRTSASWLSQIPQFPKMFSKMGPQLRTSPLNPTPAPNPHVRLRSWRWLSCLSELPSSVGLPKPLKIPAPQTLNPLILSQATQKARDMVQKSCGLTTGPNITCHGSGVLGKV